MGASNFTDFGHGGNLATAYRNACRDAEDEFGTDAYNGTITTTSGCIELPPELFKGMSVKHKVAVLQAVAWQDDDKGLTGKGKKAYAAILDDGFYVAEKWERCLALKTGPKQWHFAGWAAE